MEEKKPLKVAVIGTGAKAAEIIGMLTKGAPLQPTEVIHEDNLPPPAYVGEHGRAWKVHWASSRATFGPGANIADWVIEARWAHPMWHSYWVALIHLRRYEGDPGPPLINLPGATHELIVHALNADFPRAGLIRGAALPQYLTPPNFVAQIVAESDAAAIERVVSQAVIPVVQRRLSPDTDHRSAWVALFGDSMVKR